MMFPNLYIKNSFISRKITQNFKKIVCFKHIGTMKINYNYLCDSKNTEVLQKVISLKKSSADINRIIELYQQYLNSNQNEESERLRILKNLEKEAIIVPNIIRPDLHEIGEEPKILDYVNPKPTFNFKPQEMFDIGTNLGILHGGKFSGIGPSKAFQYYFVDTLAKLEQALIK